jgi:hypothetical protein
MVPYDSVRVEFESRLAVVADQDSRQRPRGSPRHSDRRVVILLTEASKEKLRSSTVRLATLVRHGNTHPSRPPARKKRLAVDRHGGPSDAFAAGHMHRVIPKGQGHSRVGGRVPLVVGRCQIFCSRFACFPPYLNR